MAKRKAEQQSGGVSVGDVGGSMRVEGDIITVGEVGAGAAVAAGRSASASVGQSSDLAESLAQWRSQMVTEIEALPDLSDDEKQDLQDQVDKIQEEAAKAEEADPGRLERLINTLSVMAPDIFEVAAATLVNPLAGIGLVIKKVGDKAKLEREAAAS